MNLPTQILVFVFGIYLCDAGYGGGPVEDVQSDVQAPPYVPPYAKNTRYSKTGYSRYAGAKTAGRKTSYTKTGQGGTKTGYAGTKTGYTGTKTGYATNNVDANGAYAETKSWSSGYGNGPSYQEFHNNADHPDFAEKCTPQCKNNGICVDTNTCHCPANFYGQYCEFEKKPCMSFPPLPMNSRRKCSNDFCTISCIDGHKFIDGTTVANMRCLNGQWQPTRADITTIPDCEPECSPPCLNGGVCLSLNTCQCPEGYRGPQCQYSTAACDVRKLAFNGGYNCYGDGESFSCHLSCPSGSTYSSPPAEKYTCAYSSGVFQPQPIPHCVFNEVVIVTPSNNHDSYHYSSWNSSSWSSHSHSGYGESGYNEHGYNREGYNREGYNASGYNHEGHYNQAYDMTIFGVNQTHVSSGYGQGKYEVTHNTVVIQDLTPKGGVCLTWAGMHYKTFDGKIYSFKSPCQHILVRDATEHKYMVLVKQGDCKSKVYCPAEITVYLEDKFYVLGVGEDGSVLFKSSKRLLPIPASLPGIRVSMTADYVQVNLDAQNIAFKWDTNTLIQVEGTAAVWNKTEGLCGRLDGNPGNDMVTKEGVDTQTSAVLASSWQINKVGDLCDSSPTEVKACAAQADDEMKKALQFCTKVFSKEKFRKCSKVMDVTLLLETCKSDYCTCTGGNNPEECACATVSVYAKECLRHGVEEMRNWRDADTCPIHCPEGKIYKSCGPDAQPSCAFPLLSSNPDNSTCVEGCFCPDGLLLEGGRCVPKNECPCRLRNKVFQPGAVVPKDCNTCTCQGGEWTCTQVPCGARCSAIGDPHYTTFDGLRYDFMGHCTYTLLQAKNITVEVENVACSGAISEAMNLVPFKGEGKPSCTKAVNLNYGAARIHLKQGGYILVNGQEVASLPVRVGDVKIRAASSLFIIVQMPNKVDLWWDGNTRVFVDVPPEFHGKTKGLCGTFNLNQKDDFFTPEGDVEQSPHAFANKWKSRELCDDVSMQEPEHPCKTHVENKQEAEKYCARLKSKLFEPCHWHVDVEPYYEACLYDMCACAGDAARCLCPVLGEYAMLCAKSGVSVQWRYNVKECELQCTGGQEYTVCADSCVRTCADLALSGAGACKPQCVEGCACPSGQVLDANNVCVPVGMCPCFHKGLEFKPGYKEVRPGRIERELCTCVGARWDCQSASSNDIQNYPPAEDLRSNCSAINHLEFTTCEIAEPLTCKNMHLPPSTTTAECRPGCQCKKGYVLDTSSKKCVLPSQCPCHHGGRSYPDGHSMKEDCNTCECKSGNWTCTTLKCAGSCAAWGDSHIATFDGTEYDFEGVCTYLLAKGAMDGSDGFDVEIQNVPCGTTGATCSKSLTLKVGSGNNEEIVSLTKDAPLPDLSKLKRIKLRIAGAYVFLDVLHMGVSVQWDRGMRVYIKLDSMWHGRVKGLCGNYNGDMRDDFQKPGGGIPESSALIFADSWKLKPTCPKARPVTDHCKQRPERKDWATTACGELKRYPFTLCHTEVPVTEYVARCERDACACDAGGDCDCLCTALAAYAHQCAARGVSFKWRTKEICPMQCDEECSNYNECVSACPLETCDNTLDYTEIKTICENDVCVEGCKPKKSCPEGTVYSNNTFTECVPRSKCKPVCLTLADGRQVLEGEVIEEDACHTCRCSKKHRVCTGQPCSSSTQESFIITTPTYIEESSTSPPIITSAPNDKPLACITGWTEWLSSGTPEEVNGQSVEKEPLPKINQLTIGSPMCVPAMMKKIECRTKVNHKTAKETGLDVECSLERGLVCKEKGGLCPDFEIRVYCECEEGTTIPQPDEFQCLNSDHPNYPHPTDCTKFYECTPDPMYPDKPHKVLKSCGEGLLYNPALMVCDWPTSVMDVRPECNESNAANQGVTKPARVVEERSRCPAGQVFYSCAYECDKLCDHFKKTLMDKGMCKPGEKCVVGCVDQVVASTKCEFSSRWRDDKTCVPLKDCTCYHDGKIVKPNGVVTDGCVKCQCIDNSFHCDSSDCVSISIDQQGSTHLPMVSVEAHRTVELVTRPATQTTPLLVRNTATPPPECSPDHYKNLLWEDEPLPETAFSASSIASELFKPQYAKLNGHPHSVTAGSWNPDTHNNHQYIQVALPRREPVYGVIIQGSPLFDQYVTSYEVMYGDDGSTFSAVEGSDGKPKVFRGPVDHNTPAKQMFEQPIEAKIVRIRPLTWHDEIAVRFELIGCQQVASTPRSFTPVPIQCTEPLGLAAELPIDNIEVSSNNDLRRNFLLDGERGWRPVYSTPGEWIMFDFTAPRNITGIKTKGGASGWVTSYNIMYTSDLSTFNPVVDNTGGYKIFPANFDKDSVVVNEFRPPIHARYLKVLPLKWKDHIEMRVEPIGCFEPYPVTQTVPPEATVPVPIVDACEPCPGVRASHCACAGAARYYDGEGCVSRDQCPCVEGFMSYAVGSTFRGTNCDECVCKLGGITDCKPVKECMCAPNLVPKLSKSSCECLCEPCPNGTKICPTSKLCLSLSKWCDGLQDCPDDEKDCYAETSTASQNAKYIVSLEPTVVTTVAPTVGVTQTTPVPTTVKPTECPVVECPPGYMVRYTSGTSYTTTTDIPPPQPRNSYRRYHRGGYAKGGFSKGGYSKGGYSKGGYSKGGYTPLPPAANPSFTLDKPALNTTQQTKQECAQFKCIPKLPPPFKPGVTSPPMVCSTPECPKDYRLMLDNVPLTADQCPQYVCVPPVERPVFCNVTGRTFNTFDGAEYKYDVCFHILARENRFDSWTVLVRKKCRLEGCINELMVHQDDQLILVKPNLMIEYDNYEYTVEQTSKICFQKNSFDVARIGSGLSIKSRKYNFTVLYSTDGDVKIGVPKKYMGSIDGLCGAFDGDLTNERRLPNGQIATSIDEFGRAWAKPGLPANACHTKLIPPEKQKRVWELCDVITKEPISQCGKVLNLDKWRSICLEKICECADLVINGTKRTEEECRCLLLDQIVAECLAADRNVDLSGWRIQRDCPAECPAPLVHYDCYRRRCEPTCSTIGAATHSCPVEDGQCFPGCYCPEGKLRKGDQCVLPSDCLDCSCTGAGAPAKYLTFESDDLPYLGNCTYLASRDRNETGQHKYEVYASNGPCEGGSSATCVKAVHVIYDKNVIHITKDDAGKKLVTTVGDVTVYKYPWKRDWIAVSLVNGQDVNLELTDAHVELTVEKSKMEFGVRVPSYVYANRTEGLCGVCAGAQEHLLASNGTYTDDFDLYGKSWQATPSILDTLDIPPQEQCGDIAPEPECRPPSPEHSPCYTLLNADRFGACYALIDPHPFIESCEAELCASPDSACASLERYAAECRRQGVCLSWRDELCPYNCEPPLVYRPCVDCERTCENHEELDKNPKLCDKSSVEGCFCPEGKVRVNNTCIEPTKCFPCDANKEHYAGDEWQEDACTRCACSKAPRDTRAHVACTTHTCAAPVCAAGEKLLTTPTKGCCPDHVCVPKPEDIRCEEPKKMECGFGQVLKTKTTSKGCKEFTCECKPPSECDRIPSANEVDILEPGMERVVDNGGCCPRVEMVCRVETCPKAEACPLYHTAEVKTVSGKCCPEQICEPPKEKCIVTLEWEAASKGGEKSRTTPQVVLKDLDSVWLDGPCRSCRCEASPLGHTARCAVTECPPLITTEQFVLEPRPVPFACCPIAIHVACRDGDNIYRVGENWTSPYDLCESYQCVEVEDGKLEKITTVQACHKECELAFEVEIERPEVEYYDKEFFKYINASVRRLSRKSPYTVTIYTYSYKTMGDNVSMSIKLLENLSGRYQPTLLDTEWKLCEFLEKDYLFGQMLAKQFPPNESCPFKPGYIYFPSLVITFEQFPYVLPFTWPFKTIRVRLDLALLVTATKHTMAKGWKYFPEDGECCGRCKPVECVCEGKTHAVGEKWTSPDQCAHYTCVDVNGTLQVQSSNETCPIVSVEMKKQFVYEEKTVPGKCCKEQEPVACRVGNDIYQEGQTWPSGDPCKNISCARDASNHLAHTESIQMCETECAKGWKYQEPPSSVCCGHCVQHSCVVDDIVKPIGSKWYSADNCTTYTCDKIGDEVSITSSRQACPDVSHCALEDLVNETCCQICKEKPMALSTCVPTQLGGPASVGAVRVRLGVRGLCVNTRPLQHFSECRGTCDSGTVYNNQTGSHDSLCRCCQATQYSPVTVPLACEDGTTVPHRVASPARCSCERCGSTGAPWGNNTKQPTKSGTAPAKNNEPDDDDFVPEIYRRFGTTPQ